MNSLDVLAGRVARGLEMLSFRDREVLKLRYGLSDGYSYTPTEIGRIWKKDGRWASRTIASAIRKLQRHDATITRDSLCALHAAGCTVDSSRSG